MTLRKRLLSLYWGWRYRHHADRKRFDSAWYRRCYHDVRLAGVDPWAHYVRFGKAEGRAPGPNVGVEFDGTRSFQGGRPTWLVVGHQAGPQLYGAERSLVDVLRLLGMQDINLVLVLPSDINQPYIDQLRAFCWRLHILPYGWWYRGESPVAEVQDRFRGLLRRYQPQALYANTLVLEEPLVAARELGIPTIMHVREVLAQDADLQTALNADEQSAQEHLRERADIVVANSHFTAHSLGIEPVKVVPNPVDLDAFSEVPPPCRSGTLVVGMISSNLPKKGLLDFVALANRLYSENPLVLFQLIGPENSHVEALRRRQSKGEISPQITFDGYRESVAKALGSIDVVLNLSSFQESFGRTVAEAMAAGRPVVAYNRGAIPELIDHEENGYLTRFGDVEAVANILLELAKTPSKVLILGEAARLKAKKQYAFEAVTASMCEVVESVDRLATDFDRSLH